MNHVVFETLLVAKVTWWCVISHWCPAECTGFLRLPQLCWHGVLQWNVSCFSQKHSAKLLRMGWSLLLTSGKAKEEVGRMESTQYWWRPTSHLSRCFYLAFGKRIPESSLCFSTDSLEAAEKGNPGAEWLREVLGALHGLDVETQRSDFPDWFKLPRTVTLDKVPGVSASYFPLQWEGDLHCPL